MPLVVLKGVRFCTGSLIGTFGLPAGEVISRALGVSSARPSGEGPASQVYAAYYGVNGSLSIIEGV